MTDLPEHLSATYWAKRKAQEEPDAPDFPERVRASIAKWDRVVEELALLYELWAAGNDTSEQVEMLMQAYDDWLD